MKNSTVMILGGVLALLLLAILAGTIYAFASGLPRTKAAREQGGALEPGEGFFEGIGTIRAKTRESATKIVAVSISCLYNASDIQFKDELKSKAPELRRTCEDYFAGKSEADLGPAFEGRIKAELRDKLNSLLVLGKLKAVYFADFAVIN
jgi:flagellar basal body-associated protein FliL